MSTPPTKLENLTESLQRYLGLQQAQTVKEEDITADALARLHGARGDVSQLQRLWEDPGEVGPDLVDGWNEREHRPALVALQRVLGVSLAVKWNRQGHPDSFLPFAPTFVASRKVSTIYRELGRSVVDGLWGRPGFEEVRKGVAARAAEWGQHHPLALVLAPLCPRSKGSDGKSSEKAHLAEVIESDASLHTWVDSVVAEDWRAWLQASARLSVDEQVETMTGLVCLHLHVALLRRLAVAEGVVPCFFVVVEGQQIDPMCARAASNIFSFWRDRAEDALGLVAQHAIANAAATDLALKSALEAGDWTTPRLWATLDIRGGAPSRRSTSEYQQYVKEAIEARAAAGAPPAAGEVHQIVVQALQRAFTGPSRVAAKVKDHLRLYGRAAGIVGPDDGARKRYQLDERALNLLARLHAMRSPDHVRSDEEDKMSVEALLDDIFERYGIIVTIDRDRIHRALGASSQKSIIQRLRLLFPGEERMRHNRANLERRLDDLRFVRRYSDASAVIHIA
ncbi:hypothetical protein [Sorangium sp. So ce1335]|uniref:hypothetical protein n=1 Tax=Sorangium sp. So ce1335 TaxID=3133335 RepID=UPI003F61621B